MKTILITGVSGFIGDALARSLVKTHRVIALSRKTTTILGATNLVGDFSVPEELHRLDEHPIDVLIHLAAVTGVVAKKTGCGST